LLRFFRAEPGLRFLDSGRINLTPPTAFNDPFELCAAVPRREIMVDEMRACFLKPNGVLRFASQMKRRLSDDAYVRWVEEVALRQPEHWCKSFRNAAEGFQWAAAASYGIACFMELDEGELIKPRAVDYWDRYAENHHGIAVEFDPNIGLLQTAAAAKWLFPVSYYRSDERPEWELGMTMDDASALRELRLRAAQKADVWKDESEWRLIGALRNHALKGRVSTYIDGDRLHHLLALWTPEEKAPVTRVFLGFRSAKELERSILAACSQPQLSHVEVLRAEASQKDYSIFYRHVL
jgi:hypothetical protein